jgi:BlaI family penicillinase repressor
MVRLWFSQVLFDPMYVAENRGIFNLVFPDAGPRFCNRQTSFRFVCIVQTKIFNTQPVSTSVENLLDVLYTCRDDALVTPQPTELTEAEWTIIKSIWDNEPCSAPAIQELLFKKTAWTYSTVRTFMDRMVTKGLLHAEKSGKLTVYRSAVTREQAQRGELLYALKHAFNDSLAPMVQCLLDTKNVSRDELDQLKRLIAEHEQTRSAKRSSGKIGGKA